MVRLHNGTSFYPTLLDGHVEGVHDEVRVLTRVDGPTNDAPRARVEHATAIDLAFSRWMFRDVGHPKFVDLQAREIALD